MSETTVHIPSPITDEATVGLSVNAPDSSRHDPTDKRGLTLLTPDASDEEGYQLPVAEDGTVTFKIRTEDKTGHFSLQLWGTLNQASGGFEVVDPCPTLQLEGLERVEETTEADDEAPLYIIRVRPKRGHLISE